MGFHTSRRSAIRESTDSEGFASQQRAATHRKQSTSVDWTTDIDRGESQYGMKIPDAETLQRLQISEDTFGDEVHDWIDEGMPAEIMGKTRQMEAFRQRQADRPPEVPIDIERQNKRSVLRSEQTTAETTRAGETGVPESVRDVISSSGRSLDASIQRAMEDRMDESFGDVQIHTGSTAAAACEAINARAFTVGSHIAFNQGEYDPESPEGQHVLAHELAHVRQQTNGAVSMLPQEEMELEVDPDPALEREAEETAQQVMADGPVTVSRMESEMHIQRLPTESQRSQAKTEADERFAGTVPTDPQALAKEVDRIKHTQQELVAELSDDSGVVDTLGQAAGSGAVGAVGGLLGAAAGSMIAPGVGTAGGAVTGQQALTELSSSIASDVSKAAYEPAYDHGTEMIDSLADATFDRVEQLIDEKIRKRLEETEISDAGDVRSRYQ